MVGCCKVRDIGDSQTHLRDFYARIRHEHETPRCALMLRARAELSKSLKILVQYDYDPVENAIRTILGTQEVSQASPCWQKLSEKYIQNETPRCTLMLRARSKLSKSLKTLVQHRYDPVEKVEFIEFQHQIASKLDMAREQG